MASHERELIERGIIPSKMWYAAKLLAGTIETTL